MSERAYGRLLDKLRKSEADNERLRWELRTIDAIATGAVEEIQKMVRAALKETTP